RSFNFLEFIFLNLCQKLVQIFSEIRFIGKAISRTSGINCELFIGMNKMLSNGRNGAVTSYSHKNFYRIEMFFNKTVGSFNRVGNIVDRMIYFLLKFFQERLIIFFGRVWIDDKSNVLHVLTKISCLWNLHSLFKFRRQGS